VPSDASVEGDIEMDALDDCILYFLYAARTTPNKTGTTNLTYTFVGNANAIPTKTLSITVIRNGIVFAYVGCVVSSYTISISDGVLIFNCSIVGTDEATQSLPTPVTWPTSTPYGAGMYSIEIPTASAVTDTDSFEFQVEDNAEAQFRAKSTGRGAQFVSFGERNVGLTVGRDFLSKADYDAFKALTAQTVTLAASKGANNSISILVPVAIKNSYELGLSGQGDLIRGNIAYTGIIGSPASYQITVKTQEDIV
jgi:hypothetical protein